MSKKAKIGIFTVVLGASLALAGCSGAGGNYVDGTYEGSAQGAKSEVKVAVEIKGKKIANIEIVEHGETQSIIDAAVETTIPEIIEKQTTEGVDVVSGASKSSAAVIEAVAEALEGAQK
ncbi:FMN-binding protein [Paenibacillus oralis]|uniref:FMN-binding protein n=1 Tax=Paenibacillus oralis TaxID=2490856 RepID=A0A3P3U8R2_9BACL|nr:FMN-binding protein [Paenibacillus oralis]RRJ66735.1 FMN-binding protein [Paenibacillus oralis]